MALPNINSFIRSFIPWSLIPSLQHLVDPVRVSRGDGVLRKSQVLHCTVVVCVCACACIHQHRHALIPILLMMRFLHFSPWLCRIVAVSLRWILFDSFSLSFLFWCSIHILTSFHPPTPLQAEHFFSFHLLISHPPIQTNACIFWSKVRAYVAVRGSRLYAYTGYEVRLPHWDDVETPSTGTKKSEGALQAVFVLFRSHLILMHHFFFCLTCWPCHHLLFWPLPSLRFFA